MTNKYGNEPLGKSVEEVEQESGNLVNSPVEGEVHRAGEAAAVIPAVVGGTASGVPAVVNPAGLVDEGSGADDGRAHSRSDGEV